VIINVIVFKNANGFVMIIDMAPPESHGTVKPVVEGYRIEAMAIAMVRIA
jgi:hypothetical protein